ncbi:MAG: bifunctional methylenetetrahydrofolate dehydrogenase/methenyltetrahydrofolate cyclohydrolase FolD [Acidobacteriota bacterium]
MTAKLLDGTLVAETIKQRVAARVLELVAGSVRPGLAAVIVGDNPASRVYVGSKVKACEALGLYSEEYELPKETTTTELIALVNQLNENDAIDGILVQLPLPPQIDAKQALEAIDPAKDVDGFHPINVGKLVRGEEALVACTPAGIIELLDYYQIPIVGAHAVVVGRSDIVGKPMAMLLLHRNATVTICHSKTRNLPAVTRQADILIAAIGRTAMITGHFIQSGAVVVDVGMNRVESADEVIRLFPDNERAQRIAAIEKRGYSLIGDVEPRSVIERASYLTPVPGGVGPLTIAMLMQNTLRACQRRRFNS